MKRSSAFVLQVPDSMWSRAAVVRALDNRDIPCLLALLRQYAGCSQNDLASVTGITQGRISEYMRGLRQPTLDTIERIANGIDMPQDCRRMLGLAPRRVRERVRAPEQSHWSENRVQHGAATR